jgi:hypothetical protein
MACRLGIVGLAGALLLGGSALAAAQTGASPGVPMLAAQVEIVLGAHGYTDLQGLERDGSIFRVRSATRYGEPVGPLQVDAITGQVLGEKPMNAEQVQAMLRERGFSDVATHREGNTVLARAQRDGSEIEMRIDARTGAVTHQAAE